MKTTLFIVGICNLAIACSSTHPRTIDLNLIVTQPVNNTETVNTIKRCDLSEFINAPVNLVSKEHYRQDKDVLGYVEALESKQTELMAENISILKTVLKCHSLE